MLTRLAKLSHHAEFLLLIVLVGNVAFNVAVASAFA
jgi:hypothetical protein